MITIPKIWDQHPVFKYGIVSGIIIIISSGFQTQCTTDTLRNNDKLTVPLYTDHCSAICFTKVIMIMIMMTKMTKMILVTEGDLE